MLATAQHIGTQHVLAFCPRTTGYADLLRHVAWGSSGIEAVLAAAELSGRSGAQVLVPRASGEALSAFLEGRLVAGWLSSDGIPIYLERLP
jgi:hypothetical protein